MIKIIITIIKPLLFSIRFLKGSRIMSLLRREYFNSLGASIPKSVNVQRDVCIWGCKNVEIGEGSFLGEGVRLIAYEKNISIGCNVLLASGTKIITRSHVYEDVSRNISDQGYINAPVKIGNDVWIGFNTIILPGIIISDKVIIGANSVVTKNLVSPGVYAGVPAKFIKDR